MKRGFASDNNAGVHPDILKEIVSDTKIETVTENIFDAIKCDSKKKSLINLGVV